MFKKRILKQLNYSLMVLLILPSIINAQVIIEEPTFSQTRGFYNNPFTLTISSNINGAKITYTLDGSDPVNSSNSFTADSPVEIAIDPNNSTNRGGTTPGVHVRAIASGANYSPSRTATHTYIFISEVISQTSPAGIWPEEYNNTAGYRGFGTRQDIDYEMSTTTTEDSRYSNLLDDALLEIPTYSLVFSNDDLFGEDNGIYVNAANKGSDWERPISVEMIDSKSNTNFQVNAGLRMRGRFSRVPGNPKHSMRLLFKKKYGDSKLVFPVFGDEGTDTFDKIDFRCAQNQSWNSFEGPGITTFLKEVFARDTQSDMGNTYTKSRYCHLYLNGMYWGMYQIQERAEENFAETYFGGDKADYDILKPNGDPLGPKDLVVEAVDGDTDSGIRMWNKVQAGLSSNTDYFEIQGMDPNGTRNKDLERLLDIDNLIDYLLIAFYTGSTDGPIVNFNGIKPNNFLAILDREKPDGFKWIVHDMEKSMLVDNLNSRFPLNITNLPSDFIRMNPIAIHQELMNNPEYRIKFADRAYRHFENDGVFTVDNILDRIEKNRSQIFLPVIAEAARWGDGTFWAPEQNHQNWVDNVDSLLDDFVPFRTNIVIQQFKDLGIYTTILPPVLSSNGTDLVGTEANLGVNTIVNVENSNSAGTIYYTTDGTDPRLVGGDVASSATVVSDGESITIDRSMKIQARIKDGANWSSLIDLGITVNDNFEHLKVTEVHYNPLDLDDGDKELFEFIEFKNTGTEAITLTGLYFEEGIDFEFGMATLDPGNFFVIASDATNFNNRYGFDPDGVYEGSLKNSGEEILLVDAIGNTVLSFEYSDESPWPTSADGLGNSLVSKNSNPTGVSSDFNYWKASSGIDGSPNADDSGLSFGPIIITEVLSHTDEPLVDAIELFNPTNDPIDVGYWFLSDKTDNPKRWQIPANTIIPANSYLVFNEGHYNGASLEYAKNEFGSEFSLSSHGEDVVLYSGNISEDLTGYANHVSFGEIENGISFGRYINSEQKEFFVAMESLTLGTANSTPRVGPIVFLEINYNPTGDTPEFVALRNVSSATVNLFDNDNNNNTWKIEGIDFDFPLGISIESNETIFIIEEDADISSFKTDQELDESVQVFNMNGGLSNSGETIGIYKAAPEYTKKGELTFEYITIEEVEYNDKAPWPVEADGFNAFLARVNENTFANDATNWLAVSERVEPGQLTVDSEEILDLSIGVHPNPTKDYINIQVEGNKENSRVFITDLTGKTIHSESLTDNKTFFNVLDFETGVYIIYIQTSKGIITEKFIKE